MSKITFSDFECMMKYSLKEKLKKNTEPCIEILFCVDDCEDYQESWLGKMLNQNTNSDLYWFGLTPDGLQGYNFNSFEEFINAKVFCGKNLKEVWDSISLLLIDACDVEERLQFYVN